MIAFDPLDRPCIDTEGVDQMTKRADLLKKLERIARVDKKYLFAPLNNNQYDFLCRLFDRTEKDCKDLAEILKEQARKEGKEFIKTFA